MKSKVVSGAVVLLMAIVLATVFDVKPLRAQVGYASITFRQDGDKSFRQAVLEGRARATIGVDGIVYNLPTTFFWQIGSTHYVLVHTPIIDSANSNSRYVFFSWSDGVFDPNRTITIAANAIYNASFLTEHYLTMLWDIDIQQTGGVTVDECEPWLPGSDWYSEGRQLSIYSGTPTTSEPSIDFGYDSSSWIFDGWIGTGNGSYTGTTRNPQITVNGPITETAYWRYPYHVYDQPFGWKDKRDYAAGAVAEARVTVNDNGWIQTYGMVDSSFSVATIAAGVGHDLDESDGEFEIRMSAIAQGFAPPPEVQTSIFFGLGLSVQDLDENKIILEEVARDYTLQGGWVSEQFIFATTVTLKNHRYRFFGWVEIDVSTEDFGGTEWDFEDTFRYIYLGWLEIRETSNPDFGLAIVGMPETISIPKIWVPPGESVELPIEIRSRNDFWSDIELSIDRLPPETAYGFSNPVVRPPPDGIATTLLTITTSPETPNGYYTLRINGTTAGGRTHMTAMTLRVSPPASAAVDIDPDTLNLRSEGEWITVYVELLDGYDVNAVDVSTVRLNDAFSVDPAAPVSTGDYDGDGMSDLMAKFNRTEITAYLYNILDVKFEDVVLTVSGKLKDGTLFEGSDIVRAIFAGDINGDELVNVVDLAMVCLGYGALKGEDAYDLDLDLNNDDIVDMKDLRAVAINLGARIPE